MASFRGWHPAVTEMIRAAASPIRWGLFTVRPLLRWYRDRVVILGDAAHGMLPHHGQGANTSIEDAFALAGLLAKAPGDDLEATFSRYQALRRARTRKIQRSSWVTSSLLHLADGRRRRRATRRSPRCRRTSGGSTSTTCSRHCKRRGRPVREPATAAAGGKLMPQDHVLDDITEILGDVAASTGRT